MSTFDLDEARRLHDRDPDNPRYCLTRCTTDRDDPALWPCATAIALGATGYSEWTGPDDLTSFLEAAMHPDIVGAGTFLIPKIIHFDPDTPDVCGHRDPNSTATCNRTHGHTSGPHTTGNGTTQWSTDPCRFDSINLPGGKWCILNRGHHGPCRFEHKGTQIHRCTTTGGTNSTLTCALATGHRTDNPHTTINGTEWDTND